MIFNRDDLIEVICVINKLKGNDEDSLHNQASVLELLQSAMYQKGYAEGLKKIIEELEVKVGALKTK